MAQTRVDLGMHNEHTIGITQITQNASCGICTTQCINLNLTVTMETEEQEGATSAATLIRGVTPISPTWVEFDMMDT